MKIRMGWSGLAFTASFVATNGCFLVEKPETQRSLRSVFETPVAPSSDRVILDYRIIDQPAGDPFVIDQLWTMVRCPLSHDRAALLAENGLRVGVMSGIVPNEFIARVTSERYVVDPRAIATRAGEEKVVPMNGPFETIQTRIVRELASAGESINAQDAECGLVVKMTPDEEDRIRFRCTLAIQTGSKQAWLRPSADRTQFKWDRSKSREILETLAFEVTLGPGEYLVVGPTEQPGGTLGELFCFVAEPTKVHQRFLVLRGRAEAEQTKTNTTVAAQAGSNN